MSEKKLIDGPLSDDERSVLESIQLDRPSRESARRAAAALGLAPASAWALGGSGWLSSIAVIGAGCLAWVALHEREEPVASVRDRGELVAEAASAPVVVEPSFVEMPSEGPDVVAELEPVETQAVARSSSKPISAKREAPKTTVPSSLSEQITLLDRARSALSQGRAADALRELGTYTSRFGSGAFAQEAAVLRVQALASAGRGSEAHDEARAFSRKYPQSPHASQVSRY